MNVVADLILLLGSLIALVAGIGTIRLRSVYARLHAAGKASPVAVVVTAVGCGIHLGWSSSGLLVLVVGAMVLTLPVGVHLLYRAVHRTGGPALARDDLIAAERARGER